MDLEGVPTDRLASKQTRITSPSTHYVLCDFRDAGPTGSGCPLLKSGTFWAENDSSRRLALTTFLTTLHEVVVITLFFDEGLTNLEVEVYG